MECRVCVPGATVTTRRMKRCIRSNLCPGCRTLKNTAGAPGIIKKTFVIAADEVLWEEHDDVWKVNLEKLMEVGL